MHDAHANGRFSLQGSPAPERLEDFAEDVRCGLRATPKRLSCRYIYDAEGSRLFEEICGLPEYYPTRSEASILRELAPELVSELGEVPELVELGSGSAEKTRLLIQAFLEAKGSLVYRPIDISADAVKGSARALLEDYPELRIEALAMDYHAGLAALGSQRGAGCARLVLWLGSSIGNFSRSAAVSFLGQVRAEMEASDRMLVGIDLRKDAAVLEAAYDDSQGVTAAFNKNLLKRINTSFAANFDLGAFSHRACYLEEEGRIEMWLVSDEACTVRIEGLDLDVSFRAGEGIHTESSYKYSAQEIQALAEASGFGIVGKWTDAEQRFCDVLLAPVEP